MRHPTTPRACRRRTMVAGVAAAFAVGALARLSPAAVQQHVERVEVARVVVDTRVLDARGRPVRGLGLDDFRVFIDGEPARIESVRWEGDATFAAGADRAGRSSRAAPLSPDLAAAPAAGAGGHLTVLFFQKDMHESRITGLQLLLDRAGRLVDRASPADRFAVVSFDSHLRLWIDFSDTRGRLREVLERGILFESPPPRRPGGAPSLLAAIDPSAARRAASMEQALAVVARALEPIDGAKSLILFAWGFGRLAGMQVFFEPGLEEAAERLRRSRVSVFSVDVTRADHHTLEASLQTLARATGGFYLRTNELADAAMARLESALAGHYVILVERPERPPGTHVIRVELTRARATVLARPQYTDTR